MTNAGEPRFSRDPATDRVDAFVGPKADYYRPILETFASGRGSKLRFNFAAAFCSVGWLLYRKLYLATALLLLAVTVDVAICAYLEEAGLVSPGMIAAWDRISPLVYAGVVGAWANYWYFLKFKTLDADSKTRSPDPEVQEEFLTRKGGVIPVAPIIVVLAAAALIFWANR